MALEAEIGSSSKEGLLGKGWLWRGDGGIGGENGSAGGEADACSQLQRGVGLENNR